MPPDRMVLALALQLIFFLKHLPLGFPREPCCISFVLNLLHVSANYYSRMSQTRRLKRTGSSCLGLLVRLTPSGSEGDCPWAPLAGSFIDSLVTQQFLCACLQRSCHLLPGSACVLLFF